MFSKTVDGIEMNLWDLDPRIVTVPHIANALARINRYAGHWVHPISVARHCLALTDELKKQHHPAGVQLQGLFHDATEAYTQDIPTPLKDRLSIHDERIGATITYRGFEERMLERIYCRLNIPWPIPLEVWNADTEAYNAEILLIRRTERPRYDKSNDPEVVAAIFVRRARNLMDECGILFVG
jgi:hypothetical protein